MGVFGGGGGMEGHGERWREAGKGAWWDGGMDERRERRGKNHRIVKGWKRS